MMKRPLFWSDYPFGRHAPSTTGKRARNARKIGLAVLLGMFAPVLPIFLLRWMAVPTSAFMLRASLKGHHIAFHWVDRRQISQSLPISVVAAEDQNFPSHHGFDFKAIAEALDENKYRARPRGASTISQQVAKNLFLWPGRSWLRKGLEAYLTVWIELLWPKRRILEVYLNIAEFGPDVFGVGAASQIYFNVPPLQLNDQQAALLAAVLPSPRRMDLRHPSPYLLQRAAEIRYQVSLLGGPAYLSGL